MDQESLPWREMHDIVLAIPLETNEVRQALSLMEGWDGVLAADSLAAAVFEFFVSETARRIAQAQAPHATQWALGEGFTPLVSRTMFVTRRVGHLIGLTWEQPAGWFERPWALEMADALAKLDQEARSVLRLMPR